MIYLSVHLKNANQNEYLFKNNCVVYKTKLHLFASKNMQNESSPISENQYTISSWKFTIQFSPQLSTFSV